MSGPRAGRSGSLMATRRAGYDAGAAPLGPGPMPLRAYAEPNPASTSLSRTKHWAIDADPPMPP